MLADLRPNANARAELAQLQLRMGVPEDQLFEPARRVTTDWRKQNVLVRVRIDHDGPLADLDDVRLRQELERAHAGELRRFGMAHLDISEVRSRVRPLTQLIARDLYEQGAAGVLFRSNLDNHRCVAMFEYRAQLELIGAPEPLQEDVAELRQVCDEFGLLL